MDSSAARAERVAITKKIQQMEGSFTRFVRKFLTPAGRSVCRCDVRGDLGGSICPGFSPRHGRTDESDDLVFGENAFRFFGCVKNSIHKLIGRGNAAFFEPVDHVGGSAQWADLDDLLEAEMVRRNAAVNQFGGFFSPFFIS